MANVVVYDPTMDLVRSFLVKNEELKNTLKEMSYCDVLSVKPVLTGEAKNAS